MPLLQNAILFKVEKFNTGNKENTNEAKKTLGVVSKTIGVGIVKLKIYSLISKAARTYFFWSQNFVQEKRTSLKKNGPVENKTYQIN